MLRVPHWQTAWLLRIVQLPLSILSAVTWCVGIADLHPTGIGGIGGVVQDIGIEVHPLAVAERISLQETPDYRVVHAGLEIVEFDTSKLHLAGVAESRTAGGEAPTSNFTGRVAVAPPTNGTDGSSIRSAPVTFEAGARTSWHRHPSGQLLIVTQGVGWTQIEGEDVKAIRAGDVIWTPPNASHWHGATRNEAMTHVAVSEFRQDQAVVWLGPVTEKPFQGPLD